MPADAEFKCCHGTPSTGHRPTCPYDKAFYGPAGVNFDHILPSGRVRGINFHDAGLKMHGPNSQYAKNLRERAEKR